MPTAVTFISPGGSTSSSYSSGTQSHLSPSRLPEPCPQASGSDDNLTETPQPSSVAELAAVVCPSSWSTSSPSQVCFTLLNDAYHPISWRPVSGQPGPNIQHIWPFPPGSSAGGALELASLSGLPTALPIPAPSTEVSCFQAEHVCE